MNFKDHELIQKARQGDNAAFALLWTRFEPKVLSLCRGYLAGPHRDPATDAHDLANETFILALHGLIRYEDRLQEDRGFESWLLEIARRRCLKLLDRQRRRQHLLADSPQLLAEAANRAESPARLAEERELLRMAAQEINALPDLYRLPFRLSLEEFSHREIAEALGISVDSAMQRVHRARRMLQPRLAPLFGITPGTSKQCVSSLRSIEQALTEIVHDVRIVSITLPSGGEMQLCLRVDRRMTLREAEINVRRRRLQRHPRAWKPYLDFADLCYHCGRWQEAREMYRSALDRNPACFAAALRLGEMLRKEEHIEETARIYRASLEHSPPPEAAARLRAEETAATGDDSSAVAAYHAAIALDPAERANYYGLHRALGRLSRYREQLENLAALREIAPDDIFAYDEAYTPCARLERWDLALPLMERAVEIDPNHPLALKHLFQVRMNQGLFDSETLALAERLVRLAPDFVESWSELAWIYAELGRDEESLAVLRQFLAEHPANAEAYAALAWRCHYLGRAEDLAIYARRAYEFAPLNWHVCWTLLEACKRANSAITEAETFQFAQEIRTRFPGDAFLLEKVFRLYVEWQREEEALAVAQRLQALAPSDPTDMRLAEIYRHCGRWKEAEKIYRELLARREGRTVLPLALLGEALLRLNDPEADAAFCEAEERARSWYECSTLAEIYERCGLTKKAIAAAQRTLSFPASTVSMRRRVEAQLKRLTS